MFPKAFQADHFAFPTKSNAEDGLSVEHGPSVDWIKNKRGYIYWNIKFSKKVRQREEKGECRKWDIQTT